MIVLVLLFQNCSTLKKPHTSRQYGAIGTKTENTIPSVKKAMKLHVDMIEIDVFLLNVVNGNHHISTLDEVIKTINKKVPSNFELKGKNTSKPTLEPLEKIL